MGSEELAIIDYHERVDKDALGEDRTHYYTVGHEGRGIAEVTVAEQGLVRGEITYSTVHARTIGKEALLRTVSRPTALLTDPVAREAAVLAAAWEVTQPAFAPSQVL